MRFQCFKKARLVIRLFHSSVYTSPSKVGIPIDNAGTYVTASRIPSNTAEYGSNVFVTCSMVILLIPQDTNNTEPTGGVILPIHMLNINITPNWIEDIPRLSAIGKKIGVKIRIAGVMSINIPTINKMIFIKRRSMYLLSVMDIKPLLIAAGIPEYAMTHDIAEEAEIRNRMIPLVAALFSKIFINNFISMLL